jgi:hypothetical protein
VPILGPTHEQKGVRMIFNGEFVKSKANSCSCKQSTKEHTIGDKIEPLNFQRVKPGNIQPKVTGFGYFVMPFGMGKCQWQHVLLHPKK